MSAGFSEECKRESTLQEDIIRLEKYGVPLEVRDQMLKKADQMEKWNKRASEFAERQIQSIIERNKNLGAVVDALGDYIRRNNTRDW